MSILWLTTALGLIAVLSAAAILGTFLLGVTAYLLSIGLELLLSPGARDAGCSPARHTCRPSRNGSRQPNSWMLSS
jgi:hypothetical protein